MTTNPNPDRFRRRTEIEARQWTGSNVDAMSVFCSPFDFQTIDPEDRVEDPDQTAAVRTHPHGGWVGLKPGDWVVREAGRYTTASDEEFRADWEPVSSAVSVVPPATNQTAPVGRAAVLTEAADAVFALDYDEMVGEEGDENLGSMREAWDLGTIHAEKLLRRLAAEAPHTAAPGEALCICGHPTRQHFEDACLLTGCDCGDCLELSALPEALEAALTKRFTALGNPFSEMRRHEQGPDGWPSSRPVGPHQVAEVLRELLTAAPAVVAQPGKETNHG